MQRLMLTLKKRTWQRQYLHNSTSSGLKCFSQVNTLSLSICFLKSSSVTLVFVIALSHSSRHFLYSAFRAEGSSRCRFPSSSGTNHIQKPSRAKLQNTPQLWSASLTCVGRLWRSRHNTIDAILIQWHVNELRGILKLLPGQFSPGISLS